jgi:hypothetical protein
LTGEQVLPASWLGDTLAGDPGSRKAFAASPTDTRMPGEMYRNTFRVPYPDSDVLLCLHPRPDGVCRHRGPGGRREAVAQIDLLGTPSPACLSIASRVQIGGYSRCVIDQPSRAV